MPDLLSLPNELLREILDLTHPNTLVSFALANRQIYANSLQALQIHRDRLSNLRLIHDRNPINVPSALRSAIAEPNLAWYTRSLEVWELRRNFSWWESPFFDNHNPAQNLNLNSEEYRNWPEQHYDYSHLDMSYFGDDELHQYHSLLLHTLHLSEPRAKLWMKRLKSGFDEPLKVLLMALLPRLNKITFVQFDSWQNDDSANDNPLRLFSASLRRLALLPALQWPCFQFLIEVTVGQTHDLRYHSERYYLTPHTVAPLLLLPSIQKLTLNLISHEDYEGEYPYMWEWESHISTCQDLQFNNCQLALETMSSFLGGIKALRSFNCVDMMDGCPGQRDMTVSLLKYAKSSLEVLRLEYDNDPCDINIIKEFGNLRRLEVIDRHLMDPKTFEEAQYDLDNERYPDMDRCTFGATDWIDFVASLPCSLETLTIQFVHVKVFEHEVQGLIKQLSLLVAAKSSDQFSGLREICIGNLLSRSINNQGNLTSPGPDIMRPENVGPWFVDLRKACNAKGIFLHNKPLGDPDNDVKCPSCHLFPSKDGIESLPKYHGVWDSPRNSPLSTQSAQVPPNA